MFKKNPEVGNVRKYCAARCGNRVVVITMLTGGPVDVFGYE